MDKINELYEEVLKLDQLDKNRKGELIYLRIVNSISYALKHENTVLAEHLLLAYLFRLFSCNKGPEDMQAIYMARISSHNFDYTFELFSSLHDNDEEYGELLSQYMSHHNQYVNEDLLYLSLLIISVRDDKKLNEKEYIFLEKLLVK